MITKTATGVLILVLFMALPTGPAGATPIDIGTATYNSVTYNLIYDDNPSGPVVWLDYSNPANTWSSQGSWAASLNTPGVLTYNIDPQYIMNWSSGWQLPTTINDSASALFPPSPGSSQMAYLYYTQLGNPAGGPFNQGLFSNLQSAWYWSGTEQNTNVNAWVFNTSNGNQSTASDNNDTSFLALADRPGQLELVPEPSTMLLLGVGLVGLAGVRYRRRAR